MPKSNVSSPTHSTLSKSPVNGSGDDIPSGGKLSETALRKKKNADAQAAFRQRRANYIATLEETVTSLESVVLELQDSCSVARAENSELRTDNVRLTQSVESLRHELREREKFVRAMYQAKRVPDHQPRFDDFNGAQPSPYGPQPGQPQPPGPPGTLPNQMPSLSGAFGGHTLMENALRYPTQDDGQQSLQSTSYHDAPGSAYGDRSPSLPYVTHDGEVVSGNGRPLVKMSPYPVGLDNRPHSTTSWGTLNGPTVPPRPYARSRLHRVLVRAQP